MTNKTVFIFGAGASKADGLPTQAELLKNYFSGNPQDSFAEGLNAYFKNFFGIKDTNAPDIKWPTFEEALAMVEIAMDKEQSFGANYAAEKLKEIRDGLIVSMGIAIDKCQVPGETIHKKFVGKLFWNGHFRAQEYAFVSFNYDILLDKALMNLVDNYNIYCDYGVKFANVSEDYNSSEFPKWTPPDEKNVLILKPHGSLNWMQCPKCDSLFISGDSKSTIFKTGLIHTIPNCPKDHSPMQFVIEPPSYFKKYKNYYLQTVWKKLYDILATSTKVIFIGYSMPDADVMIKYAIKRACFGQTREIVVVNPSEDTNIRERYERVLGHTDFHKIGFKELLESANYKKIIK